LKARLVRDAASGGEAQYLIMTGMLISAREQIIGAA